MLLLVSVPSAQAGETLSLEPSAGKTITLELTRIPLKEAAEQVARQTGYMVSVEKQWGEIPVTGRFTGVGIEEFFRRVLKKNNLSIITDEKAKKITVRLFGAKDTSELLTIAPPAQANGSVSHARPYQDDRQGYRKQVAVLTAWKNNPESIDPMTGTKLSQIQASYEKQVAELERKKSDPETIDAATGNKLVAIRKSYTDQVEKIERMKQSTNAIDPVTRQNWAELNRIYEQQVAELERMKHDPEAIDPMTGNKLSAIRRSYEEQINKLTAESSL